MSSILCVEHVSARYPRAPYPALENVSLELPSGHIAALLGPNGSGKSTLLRVIARIVDPAEGDVRIAGRRVRELDRRLLARLVAFVPQSELAAVGFRVREVVAMGRAPHQQGWMREGVEDRRAIDRALARCDLSGLSGRLVEELSGGEQRRVAVARALAQEPRVLLLDEPAAFLDVRHRLDLHDLLTEVVSREGVACVIALHELEAAAQLASHVVLLRGGRVVAAGAPDQVMTPARLGETFDADVQVGVHSASGRRFFAVAKPR